MKLIGEIAIGCSAFFGIALLILCIDTHQQSLTEHFSIISYMEAIMDFFLIL